METNISPNVPAVAGESRPAQTGAARAHWPPSKANARPGPAHLPWRGRHRRRTSEKVWIPNFHGDERPIRGGEASSFRVRTGGEDPVGIGILPSLPLQCPRSTPSSNRCGRWTWLGLEGTAAAGGDQELSNLPFPLVSFFLQVNSFSSGQVQVA